MKTTKTIIATLALAAGLAAAGGLWTQELAVGTNGVSLADTQGPEWRLVDALSPSNTAVLVEYYPAWPRATTPDTSNPLAFDPLSSTTPLCYSVGNITNGVLAVRGSVVPPVSGGARLVIKAASATVPVLAVVEGSGLTVGE